MAIASKSQFTFAEFDHEMAEADRLHRELPIASDMQEAITDALYAGIKENFISQATAEGIPWAPHAPLTTKIHGPHFILILSGDMLVASTEQGTYGNYHEVSDRSIVIGVDLDYAEAQQFGDEQRRIPARPFFDAPEEAIEKIEDIAYSYLVNEVVG